MFRSISTRKHHRGYEHLATTVNDASSDAKLLRSTTLPANFFGDHPLKLVLEQKQPKVDVIDKQVKKVSKVHPFFSLFERKKKKKATAKPEFARYMQYLKEGGVWDAKSDKPEGRQIEAT
ncbi:hypothetical protein QVD17_06412 [Tagetes erecta]|uniref:Uncharacterized protein n=1 Tax=Tagetes erecta TaxID=13708 RepID=A0AAD8PB96_TARER|nr:hypothetical protein QVD17_06412 [Tagetes erecta]